MSMIITCTTRTDHTASILPTSQPPQLPRPRTWLSPSPTGWPGVCVYPPEVPGQTSPTHTCWPAAAAVLSPTPSVSYLTLPHTPHLATPPTPLYARTNHDPPTVHPPGPTRKSASSPRCLHGKTETTIRPANPPPPKFQSFDTPRHPSKRPRKAQLHTHIHTYRQTYRCSFIPPAYPS